MSMEEDETQWFMPLELHVSIQKQTTQTTTKKTLLVPIPSMT